MQIRRLLVLLAAAALLSAVASAPAPAVVHEIVAQWCAGHGELEPPGLSGGSAADNFAQPLFAAGVAQIVPYPAGGAGAVLIDFDFSKPQLKIVPTGQIVPIVPGVLYVEEFMLDTSAGFANCARLRD